MNKLTTTPPLPWSTPFSCQPHRGWRVVAIACAVFLSSCAGFENTKGKVQIAMDNPEDGIQSLENATLNAPRDAGYKIDYLLKRDETIREFLSRGDNFRADGKLSEAKAAYEQVLKLDRGNSKARQALAALPQDVRYDKLLTEGENFLEQGKIEIALDRALQVLEDHPQNRRAAKLKEASMDAKVNNDIEKSKALAAKSILETPVTLQFNDATLRLVFESLSRSAGINILMDRDVKPNAKVTIFVKDISVTDAIDLILLQNQLEKRVINGNTMMIYPSNDAKKAEYEDLTIRSFQVTNADLKYLSTMLKNMLKLKEVAADERTGILVIRDTPEKLRLAAKLIAVHDMPDPEIMLEVEILEVTTSRTSNIGIKPPNSFSVTTPGTQAAMTLGALNNLTANDLLVTPLSATLNFKLEDADAKILASPRIRARNKEKAKIMIGDRVPTITNTVTPVITGSSVVTGNVTYQDVGLKLEFEPQVYANSEVGIKIALEVSNIAASFTDAQGGRSYQIGTRNANTNLRLKDGETQILGGLINDQDRNTASKIPGLGHLPFIGRLFGNNDGSDSRSEIVLSITPRIIRNLAARTPESKNIFTGTANALRERPILADPISQLKISGTFGGDAATAPNNAIGGTNMPMQTGNTAPSGQVLFNAMPAPTLLVPSAPIGQTGAALPTPPSMFVRPPTSTNNPP